MPADTPEIASAKAKDWPRVAEFFKDRHVFVTGGTGFMGKVLIEKLLYSCPDIGKIYILSRPKRGKDEKTRINDMFKLPLFTRLRKERPDAYLKVVPISGDLSAENLGISEEDKTLLQRECSIVFHIGATLKLEAQLKDALLQNTQATAYMIELAKGMKKLMAFMYVSTAFCHVDQLLLEEKTYPPLCEPRQILESLKTISDSALNEMAPKIISPHPNTYTFSKRLSETLVEKASDDIPAAIVRPSIVVPAWKEPLIGWVDNLNGPTGIIAGAGKGVIRSVHCRGEYHCEFIPVDIAINAIIAATWRRALDKKKEIQVYNITNGRKAPLTWHDVLENGRSAVYEYPFENAVWYPDGDIRPSRFQHKLCVAFFHILPALFIDFLMFIFLQKRFMMRIQKRISDGLDLLEYFTTREWLFDNENFENLRHQLHPDDNEIYFTDPTDLDHKEYIKTVVLGTREYCMKEKPETLPASRRHLRRLYWIQKIFWALVYSALIYYFLSWFESATGILDKTTTFVKHALPIPPAKGPQ